MNSLLNLPRKKTELMATFIVTNVTRKECVIEDLAEISEEEDEEDTNLF
jgi:hypothetical protein